MERILGKNFNMLLLRVENNPLSKVIKVEFFNKQFSKFLFVGLLNTSFSYTIYYLLCQTSLFPSVALALSTVVGIIFNYFSTGRLVFDNRGFRYFLKFILVYIGVYFFNLLALRSLIVSGVSPELSQALLLPAVALLTFSLMRKFVFKN